MFWPRQSCIIILLASALFSNIISMERPDINSFQNQQQLLNAIQNKNVAEVQALLQAGINPNFELGPQSRWQGNSPIGAAAYANNVDIMELLLNQGANPNTIINNETRNTALLHALTTGYGMPMGMAFDAPQSPITNQNKIINILLAHPQLDINYKDSGGDTALMMAVKYKPALIDRIFSNPHLNINAQDNSGTTALMKLVSWAKDISETLKLLNLFLMNPNLQINLADNEGRTALDHAQGRRSKQITNALIAKGATAGSPERRKMPQGAYVPFAKPAAHAAPGPIPQAAYSARMETGQAQPAYHAMPRAAQPATQQQQTIEQQLFFAVAKNDIAAVDALFKAGANPNMTITSGAVPIFFRAIGRPPMVALFLAQPTFNPNIQFPSNGKAALSQAISVNDLHAIQALLNDGRTNINLADKFGYTPLDHALVSKTHLAIKLLREKGAQANKFKIPQAQPAKRAAFGPEVYASLGLQPTATAYEILGIAQNATDEQIRAAFNTLRLKWHPDKNLDKKELATQMFLLITSAHEEIQKSRN